MTPIALVTLDTKTGEVRRYVRAAGNKAELTGVDSFRDWPGQRDQEEMCAQAIQQFRLGIAA